MRAGWEEHADRILGLAEAGEDERALGALEEAADRFPEQRPRTPYWRACLLARLGGALAALAALQAGLDAGAWWAPSELAADEDLAPLVALPGWAPLLEACGSRLRAAQQDSASATVLLDAARPSDVLLVALHGRTESAPAAAERWRPATRVATVLAVGSSRLVAPGQHVWDDRELASSEVAAAVAAAGCGQSALVYGGFSQGGALAVEEALRDGDAFVAVAPSLGRVGMRGPEELAELLPAAAARGLRGAIVTGARDPRLARAERLAEEADASNLPLRLDVVAGVGHAFPPHWPGRLRDALRFVLDG